MNVNLRARIESALEQILSQLFPPRLPAKIEDWPPPAEEEISEQGWAGNVQPKYRNGIERYFSEQATK